MKDTDIKLKKLPVGIYTLKKIINGDYLYIDKTEIALNLIENNQYIFLSRPRRFGKSLFVDTLSEIFEGNKELFKGLYIYDKWNFEKKHPVIKISFANGKVKSKEELDNRIITILKENQINLGLECYNISDVSGCFRELIIKANKKYKERVVILIDEYDKPILDNIDNPEIASEMREGLANFYSVIKGSDEFLRFAFLTGVSKFSKTSIFSGLNNITDITIDEEYGNVCGYTQNDIETSFEPYLVGVDLEKLKNWYNGYNFLKDKIYNPYNILLFIQKNKKYRNYWFESGTPTFLMKLIKENNYFLPKLSDLTVGEELLGSFDIENINLETLLFQAGYLTIDEEKVDDFEQIEYSLVIPNKEVKISLSKYIIQQSYGENEALNRKNLIRVLNNGDMKDFKNVLVTLFASIPHNNYTKNNIAKYEGYYASVIYVYLLSLGIEIIAEDVTNKGRIDLTLKTKNFIYILEFKVGGVKVDMNDNTALKQIKDKKYFQKYLSENKEIYLIGIHFSEEERNVTQVDYERVGL